jgi:hypothetical protein
MARQLTKTQCRTIAAVSVAVVLSVLGLIVFLARGTSDRASTTPIQQPMADSTAVATTATRTPTNKQVQAPPTTSTATKPPISSGTQTDTGMSAVPHLPADTVLTPTPIQGLNFLIDGTTWVPMDPSDSMDGGMNRMTKVNLMPAKPGPECDPSVSTRLCRGFVVVDADQSPFYTEDKCLTIGGPSDPTYKFLKRLDDVTINGMTVTRAQMVRCEAPGLSFVWRFPLKDGTTVMVFEIGNDDNINPLPGLEALLAKVTVATVG